MKNWKMLTAGAVALSLSASLFAGCSGGKDDGKTHIEFFSSKVENASTYKEIIKEFEKKNPKIAVDLSSPPDAGTVIKTRLTKNDMPDIVAMGDDTTFTDLANSGVLKDLSGSDAVENIQPTYIDMVKKDYKNHDAVYGVPYATNGNGVIYNKEKLAALGIEETPKTWDEFVADLDKAKEAGEIPIYFTLKDAWTGMVALNSVASSISPDQFAEDKTAGNTTFKESYDEVADKLLTLSKYGHKDNMGVAYGDGNTAFANGKGVFYLQGNWAIPELVKANPDVKLGVFPFPATNDPSKNNLVSGIDVLFGLTKDTKHEKEAKKFISFLLDKEQAQKYTDEQSAFSALKDVYQNDPKLEGYKASFESGQITSYPDHFYPTGMNAANILQEFFIKKDKDKFLKTMDKEWDKVIDRK
ncbi:ABC transporter substrate-binding protein [Falsibacillus pallidus]|uniref:Carbohydrate ABC transporter substrate-binding protein (CUT1 family) n=1 Tax=Falsibacillus pallidus TaxID=493781 RepID=A0A370FZE1_9BACI|nr:ABC transporter substrate-binding protein [Falsibacillus pallidus]RDI36892.1 carbohydrate ABC transporter substrate-binding protein (CUT1 family) [Falsibacillus pallidus]